MSSIPPYLDELGDKVGVAAVGLDVQRHPHGAGDGEILGQHLTAIDQAVMGQPWTGRWSRGPASINMLRPPSVGIGWRGS